MSDEDGFDAAWDRVADASGPDDTDGASDEAEEVVEMGPPIRVTLVVKADAVPVAPWAQGWRIGALGPQDGMVTLLFEHEIDDSPVAQLAAITGLLGTVKQAKLDLVWWAMQGRGALPGEEQEKPDLEQQLSDFLISEDQQRAADAASTAELGELDGDADLDELDRPAED